MKRRDFIKSSAIVAGSVMFPMPSMAAEKKIKIAILGTGWWGTDVLLPNAIATGLFDIIGLCDVDQIALERAAKSAEDAGIKRPALFSSYKEMYNMPGLNAVVIATPTHWHALQFIDACRQGLHVFMEKPVSYDIRESQAMLEAKMDAGNIVQVDFPRVMRGTNNMVKKYLQSGEAGKIYQVQAQIHYPDLQMVEKEIPDTLDFETYCGPAPRSKFLCFPDRNYLNWRGIHSFSRGTMVDWGIHYIHNVRKILDLDIPVRTSAAGGITRLTTHDNPDNLEALLDFEGMPVNWSHRTWGVTDVAPKHRIGVYYFGEKATVFASDWEWEIYPAGQDQEKIQGDVDFGSEGMNREDLNGQQFRDLFIEFATGIRNGSNAGITNTLEDAVKTTASVIFADLAYCTGISLAIDAANMTVTNSEAAQKLLRREYREPYIHPLKD